MAACGIVARRTVGDAAWRRRGALGPARSPIRVCRRGNVYVLLGAGGNITASVGRDGVLMVDAGSAEMTDQVLAAIRQLQERSSICATRPLGCGAETRSSVGEPQHEPPPKPIRYIINTHAPIPITSAATRRSQRRAGRSPAATSPATSPTPGEGAAILAHENVLQRHDRSPSRRSQARCRRACRPTRTTPTSMKLSHFFNGEGVQLIHQPAAHTDGDSIVYFRGSDVIATGDIFSHDHAIR